MPRSLPRARSSSSSSSNELKIILLLRDTTSECIDEYHITN